MIKNKGVEYYRITRTYNITEEDNYLYTVNESNPTILKHLIIKYYHKNDTKSKKYNDDVSYICQLSGIKKIEEEFGVLKNYDVVITDERIEHIFTRRGRDSIYVLSYLIDTIENYDKIYKDKKPETIVYVKEKEGMECAIFVKLSLLNGELANSVVTGIRIGLESSSVLSKNRKIIAVKEEK